MAKIRICLTGADGFIGSNLTKLLSSNNDVEVIPFVGDLLKKDNIEIFFQQNNKIDQIVHLAGLAGGDSFADLVDLNTIMFVNLLDIATKVGVRKVIFSSTGAVYGQSKGEESFEDDLLRPNTLYGLSKMLAEECLRYYADNFGMEYIILRFSTVYGDGNNKGVIYNFVSGIKEKGEITIYGDGTQSRNFLHVSDACRAIELAINYDKSDVFNISNPTKVTINDIVAILQKKYTFKINHFPADNNLKDLLLNISRAQKELGFNPKIADLVI